MPRARVEPKDLTALIVAALNGTSVQSGVLKATASPGGSEVQVTTHSDSASGQHSQQYAIYVH